MPKSNCHLKGLHCSCCLFSFYFFLKWISKFIVPLIICINDMKALIFNFFDVKQLVRCPPPAAEIWILQMTEILRATKGTTVIDMCVCLVLSISHSNSLILIGCSTTSEAQNTITTLWSLFFSGLSIFSSYFYPRLVAAARVVIAIIDFYFIWWAQRLNE